MRNGASPSKDFYRTTRQSYQSGLQPRIRLTRRAVNITKSVGEHEG
ncbi:hypothetical protein BOSEA31B_20593 [Hyphomicrobiales bacterium]|nr:hypothetical protein BOSEA31B_20593 [Hyphomicrobiales bacterium]CAH1702913.1 hypothetical protein BOSEA1005_30785 [Hyphomicrobiales bacterium]CAI0347100.1 hypothetical protein BO1005MUT1_530276 [Hyphomicrobiales bacterium]